MGSMLDEGITDWAANDIVESTGVAGCILLSAPFVERVNHEHTWLTAYASSGDGSSLYRT
jgi:hypothetical protein